MITTDYSAPYRDEFRITKTDVKNALKATVSSNVYKLKNEFQKTLDYIYSSIRFKFIRRQIEDGVVKFITPVYEICQVEVAFHKCIDLGCFSSEYPNTTSSDFNYTLMNTLIPIMLDEGSLTKVNDIDAFED